MKYPRVKQKLRYFDVEVFAERMLARRKKLALSQPRLAEMVGMTKHELSRFENQHKCPSVQTLMRLADALGVTTDWLLGRGK